MRESISFEKPSNIYLAWLAGFWEGEGSILYYNGSLRVTIAQKERFVLEEIASHLDGKVYYQTNSNSHRVYWYGVRAIQFLTLIAPYVRSNYRKEQIRRFCGEAGCPQVAKRLR